MTITCPRCQSPMSVDQPLPPGAAVRCPSCQAVLKPTTHPTADPVPVEVKPRKRRKTKPARPSASTWVIVGVGLVVLAVMGLFAAGHLGYGPLDFNKKDRIIAYCHEARSKVNLVLILLKENQPGALERLFDRDKVLGNIQKTHPAIQRARSELEAKDAPRECAEFKQAVLDLLRRMETWASDDVARARTLGKDDPTKAREVLEAARSDVAALQARIDTIATDLWERYKLSEK